VRLTQNIFVVFLVTKGAAMEQHAQFIRQTLVLARRARNAGDHPFGALLVWEGRVALTAVNTVNSAHDITAHAELNLVRMASRQLGFDALKKTTLYTSTEPCAMCTGAIVWAGIPTIVYGCAAETLGEIAGGFFVIPSRELFARAQAEIEVIGPVLESEAKQVHDNFWGG
jgi:tRNA(Arg) A34 adenosine deaminase TadA